MKKAFAVSLDFHSVMLCKGREETGQPLSSDLLWNPWGSVICLDSVSVVALRRGPPAFSKHWVRGCWAAGCEDVSIGTKGSLSLGVSTSHLLPTSFPWEQKPRYSERSIKSILTDPGWHDETSPQLVCTGQPHKADGALPTPRGPVCTFLLPHGLLDSQEFCTWPMEFWKRCLQRPWFVLCPLWGVPAGCCRNEAAKPAPLGSPG